MKILKALIVAVVFLAGSGLAVADDRPNILLIMTDDQGNNLGYLGNPHLETPNIDALAAESVRFTNFHQENKCTNTRASLLTGKYSHKTGAWRTSKGRSMMRAENITLAEVLRDAGYRTGHFGKWHLGEEWPYRPQDQGFEKTVHHKTGGVSQISDYWGNDYFDDTYYDGDVPTPYEGYVTNVFFGEAMKFMAQPSDEPFFVYLALNVTHLPLNVDKKYSEPYVEKGLPSGVSQYYGMIDNLDENFGELVDFLQAQGLDENTIIIFTTDDGAGAKAFVNKGNDDHVIEGWNMGLRGGKGSRYEGGHRVFFNMKLPGSGLSHDNDTLVSVMDVFPTLLELAGARVEDEVDGRSFAGWIEEPLAPAKDERPILINYFNPKDMHSRKDASVIWKNWRLTNAAELYDIDRDMAQRHDLAAEHPDLVKQLNGYYDAWDEEARPYLAKITRFQLGHPDHPVIEMTGQDHYTVRGCNSFNQSHAIMLASCLAPHKVTFLRDGRYRFTLRRYPAYTGLPFGAKTRKYSSDRLGTDFHPATATLKVSGHEVESAVDTEDQAVSFDLDIEAGDADVETRITGMAMDEEKTIPAYFLEVVWLGPDNSEPTAERWQPTWESLSQHEVPQWARDAKFGIYAHWGVYAVSGGWDRTRPNWGNYYILPYRGIYDLTGKDETFGLFEKNVGPVREGYGYKDLAKQFQPADFDPEEWADLIVKSGARYAGIAAMHHDGYAMWDSDVIRLDAGELGPQRDLLGEILAAIKARGLKTMTSFHHARTFRHFEVTQKKLRAQPGHESVDLLDPALRDYYWYAGDEDHFSDIRYRLTQEVINKYEPDVIWFDGGGGKFGTEYILADYFNMADRAGKEVVVHNKGNFPQEFGVYSYENGFDRPAYVNWPWEDDTPSAEHHNTWPWHADMEYKKAPDVIIRLIDLVARNGGLLLSLNPRPDGKLDQGQIDLLLGIGAWLEQNGDAIYDTVPWKIFAEGNEGRLPYVVSGPDGQKARPIQPDLRLLKSSDIRFTRNGDMLYATTLGIPKGGVLSIISLSTGTSVSDQNKIASIRLLGHGEVKWERNGGALVIYLPENLPNDIALSFAITVGGALDKTPPPVDSTRMKMPAQT